MTCTRHLLLLLVLSLSTASGAELEGLWCEEPSAAEVTQGVRWLSKELGTAVEAEAEVAAIIAEVGRGMWHEFKADGTYRSGCLLGAVTQERLNTLLAASTLPDAAKQVRTDLDEMAAVGRREARDWGEWERLPDGTIAIATEERRRTLTMAAAEPGGVAISNNSGGVNRLERVENPGEVFDPLDSLTGVQLVDRQLQALARGLAASATLTHGKHLPKGTHGRFRKDLEDTLADGLDIGSVLHGFTMTEGNGPRSDGWREKLSQYFTFLEEEGIDDCIAAVTPEGASFEDFTSSPMFEKWNGAVDRHLRKSEAKIVRIIERRLTIVAQPAP